MIRMQLQLIFLEKIFLLKRKLDPSVDVKNPDNNIDIYSGRFTADGGKITINSGGILTFIQSKRVLIVM